MTEPLTDEEIAENYSPSNEEYARLGHTIWHCSEEGGGPDVGITIGLGKHGHLWCGEITKDRWEDAGEDAAALGDDFGSWLILYGPTETRVLGKMVDQYTGQDFIEKLAGIFLVDRKRLALLEDVAKAARASVLDERTIDGGVWWIGRPIALADALAALGDKDADNG